MDRDSISSLLARAMYETSVRPTLEEGKTRHEIKSAHFSRKFFKTRAQLYMNGLNVEKLMDHKVGLDPNYWRPIEMELLADYLRAVPVLTINEDRDMIALKRQQAVLEQRQQDKDRQIEEMQEKLQAIEQKFGKMMDMWEMMGQKWEEVEKERKSSGKPPISSIALKYVDDVDRIIGESAKQNAKTARVKKRAS
jgi:hypothetical protein